MEARRHRAVVGDERSEFVGVRLVPVPVADLVLCRETHLHLKPPLLPVLRHGDAKRGVRDERLRLRCLQAEVGDAPVGVELRHGPRAVIGGVLDANRVRHRRGGPGRKQRQRDRVVVGNRLRQLWRLRARGEVEPLRVIADVEHPVTDCHKARFARNRTVPCRRAALLLTGYRAVNDGFHTHWRHPHVCRLGNARRRKKPRRDDCEPCNSEHPCVFHFTPPSL